jgi:hypothetical protein
MADNSHVEGVSFLGKRVRLEWKTWCTFPGPHHEQKTGADLVSVLASPVTARHPAEFRLGTWGLPIFVTLVWGAIFIAALRNGWILACGILLIAGFFLIHSWLARILWEQCEYMTATPESLVVRNYLGRKRELRWGDLAVGKLFETRAANRAKFRRILRVRSSSGRQFAITDAATHFDDLVMAVDRMAGRLIWSTTSDWTERMLYSAPSSWEHNLPSKDSRSPDINGNSKG